MLKHLYYHFDEVISIFTENVDVLTIMFSVAVIACTMFYITDEY
nr:MAG TPA: hypothetical protein [Caudoviricetes sp.]